MLFLFINKKWKLKVETQKNASLGQPLIWMLQVVVNISCKNIHIIHTFEQFYNQASHDAAAFRVLDSKFTDSFLSTLGTQRQVICNVHSIQQLTLTKNDNYPSFIHPKISIAPLQVHYYSEALPTPTRSKRTVLRRR